MKANGEILCNKTISDTIRLYLRGEIDVTIKKEERNNEQHQTSLNGKTELEMLEAEQTQLQERLQIVQAREKQISDKENSQNLGE